MNDIKPPGLSVVKEEFEIEEPDLLQHPSLRALFGNILDEEFEERISRSQNELLPIEPSRLPPQNELFCALCQMAFPTPQALDDHKETYYEYCSPAMKNDKFEISVEKIKTEEMASEKKTISEFSTTEKETKSKIDNLNPNKPMRLITDQKTITNKKVEAKPTSVTNIAISKPIEMLRRKKLTVSSTKVSITSADLKTTKSKGTQRKIEQKNNANKILAIKKSGKIGTGIKNKTLLEKATGDRSEIAEETRSESKKKLPPREIDIGLLSVCNVVLKDCKPFLIRSGRYCDLCCSLLPSCKTFQEHCFIKHSISSSNEDCKDVNEIPLKRRTGCYECGVCGYRYSIKQSLRVHLMFRHLDEKPFKCSKCDYKFSTNGQLKRHIQSHTTERPFKCNICQLRFADRIYVNRHVLRVHKGVKRLKCDFCDSKFFGVSDLKDHMTVHTGERPYSCNVCDYKAKRSGDLRRHVKTHKIGHKCQICGNTYERKSDLLTHKETHKAGKHYECSLCKRCFKRSCHLREHMRTHTGEKPYKCKFCDHKCATSTGLKNHSKIHSRPDKKPYHCNDCEYQCYTKEGIKNHVIIHTDAKPYKCTICHSRFSRRMNLKTHMATHATEKNFQCNQCNKMFASKRYLASHMKTHGEKHIECDVCGRKFRHRSGLKSHMLTHTGLKPFECNLCEYRCAHMTPLKFTN